MEENFEKTKQAMETGATEEVVARIPKGEKFTFGFYFIGQLIMYGMVSSYISLFMTESGIAAFVISAILFVAKVWDAVNDPLFAIFIDKKQIFKHKYLSWVRISTVLIPLTTIFVFIMPDSFGNTAKIIWLLIGYMLWDLAYTICDVPIHALATCMTDNVQERDGLFIKKTVFGYIGVLIVLFVPMLYPRIGWGPTAVIMSIISLATMLPVGFKAQERYISAPEKEPSFKEMGRYLVKNKPLLIISLASIVASLTATSGTAGNYVAIYLLGSEDYITYMAILAVPPAFLSILLTKFLLKKFDKFWVYIASCVSNIIFGIIIFYTGYENIPLYLTMCAIKTLFGSAGAVTGAMFIADCAEYGHYATGQRNQGVAFSVQTFTAKFTSAISTAIGMLLLGFIGFQSGSGAAQTSGTLRGVWYMNTLIPLIGVAASIALLLIGYRLRTKDAQIMAKANACEISREEAEIALGGKKI